MLDEFYEVAFRRKIYPSLEELHNDLDRFVTEYGEQHTTRVSSVRGGLRWRPSLTAGPSFRRG